MSDKELKPCPFCGGDAKVFGSNMVGCTNTSCEGHVDFGHWCGDGAVEHVINAWNTRTDDWKPFDEYSGSLGEEFEYLCYHYDGGIEERFVTTRLDVVRDPHYYTTHFRPLNLPPIPSEPDYE